MRRMAIPAEDARSVLLQKPPAVKMRTGVEKAKRMVDTRPEEQTVLLERKKGLQKTDLPPETRIGSVQCHLRGVTVQIPHLQGATIQILHQDDVTVQLRRPRDVTAQIHPKGGNTRRTHPEEETCLLKIRRGLEKTDLPLEIGTGSVQCHLRGVTGQGLQKGGSVQIHHKDAEIAVGLLNVDDGNN